MQIKVGLDSNPVILSESEGSMVFGGGGNYFLLNPGFSACMKAGAEEVGDGRPVIDVLLMRVAVRKS